MPDDPTPRPDDLTPPAADPTPPQDPQPTDPPPAGEDGAGGKRQVLADLAAERKKRQSLESELDDLRRSQMTDQEKAIQEAADKARTDVLGEVNAKLFGAEVRAATAGRLANQDLLADPEVAVRLLDLGEVPVTDTGDIDTAKINEAVASFLEANPYLASETPPGKPPVDLGQGSRGAPPPKGLDEQIADAERTGDWSTAGRLKMQKLAATPRP